MLAQILISALYITAISLSVLFVLRFVFVTFGGSVLSVRALTPAGWGICVALAFLVIPIDMIRKLIMNRTK